MIILFYSEEKAKKRMYYVSSRCYYAFGALVPQSLVDKIKCLPKVKWVLPDSYSEEKDYGGKTHFE